MNTEEVAQYLRVTNKTVLQMLEQDLIPASKTDDSWYFDQGQIDAWLQYNPPGTWLRILIIDDEPIVQALMCESLENLAHEVESAFTGKKGTELLKQDHFDLVLLDLLLPDINGNDLLLEMSRLKPDLLFIIITGYPGSNIYQETLMQEPMGIILKPFSASDIVKAVTMAAKIKTAKKVSHLK